LNLLGSYRAGLAGLDRRARVVALASALFVAARMGTVTFLGIFFVQERGLSAALVGGALFVESICRGLAAPLAGALSDRVGRRPVLLANVLATALLLPAFLLVRSPAELVLWSVLVGVAQGPYFALSGALLLDLVPPAKRQSALAVNYTAVSLGFTVGVAPAGFLAQLGYGWLALGSFVGAMGVLALYAFGLRGALPREGAPADGERASLMRDTVAALRDKRFLGFAGLALVFPIGIGLVTVPISLYAADSGVAVGTIGLVLSLNGVLLLLLAVPVNATVEASGPYRFLPLSAALLALSYAALAVGGSVPFLLANAVLFTLGEVLFSSAVPTAIAGLAPVGRRGAYQGAWGLLFAAGIGLAVLLAGAGRDTVGWRVTWSAAVALTLLAGAGLAWRARVRTPAPGPPLA
jgi:predicted MFS family arabinose efflux permease